MTEWHPKQAGANFLDTQSSNVLPVGSPGVMGLELYDLGNMMCGYYF